MTLYYVSGVLDGYKVHHCTCSLCDETWEDTTFYIRYHPVEADDERQALAKAELETRLENAPYWLRNPAQKMEPFRWIAPEPRVHTHNEDWWMRREGYRELLDLASVSGTPTQGKN